MKLLHSSSVLMSVAIGGALAIGASSCDNIDESERLIEVESVIPQRNVLVADFTGQQCNNCPLATDVISSMHEAYGDHVVAVAIHSGPQGLESVGSIVGLKTKLGDDYYDYWGIPYQPSGIINYVGGPTNYTDWMTVVKNALEEKPLVDINVTTAYDAASRTVDVVTDMSGASGITGKLQLWLVEDGIEAYQMLPEGSPKMDYVHNHVFRAAVNGDWGEDVTVAAFPKSTTVASSCTLEGDWKAENMSVVAFVYNDNGVLQVVRTPVIPEPESAE